MPEGHTLRRLADVLGEAFAGREVAVSSPQGRFADSAALLDGLVLESTDAAGKHLFLEFAGDQVVHVHLGLIGRFDLAYGPIVDPVGEVRLRIAVDADRPACADLRGATLCELTTRAAKEAVVASLGPDPLRPGADPERAYARIRRSRRSIAALLMDQKVVAGVGNVYRAEVLFRQGLNPSIPGVRLSRRRWQAIWDDLVMLMRQGVERGRIDTVRPEHEPEAMGREPREDDHGGEVYVYRRAGLPCYVCGTEIRTRVVEARNLFWCPGCQTRR